MREKTLHASAASEVKTNIGLTVRACRRQMGLSQDELALLSAVDNAVLSGIEHGAASVTLLSVVSLADVLHVPVGRLLARTIDVDGPPMRAGVAFEATAAREILMVEDNPTDAALTVRVFKRAGISNPLKITPDAEKAMEYLFGNGQQSGHKPGRPQLILLDLHLPGMSGIEFLRAVKGYPSTRHIPVVVLTASQSDQMIRECGRLGADTYIVKPLGLGSLVRATPNLSLRLVQRQPA